MPDTPSDMEPIEVCFDRPGVSTPRGELVNYTRGVLRPALRQRGQGEAALTVLYCSEAAMRRLNAQFRGIDKPTDVLSFPSGDSPSPAFPGEAAYLGDLAICPRVCIRQAEQAGRSPADELALLLVHGFLHLLGHDHDTPERERVMWEETDRLLGLSARLPRPELALPGRTQ